MSAKTVNIVFEGQRKKLDLTGRTFSSIEDAVKEKFQLEEVVLVAKQKDGTECDLWDDADLEKLPTTTEIMVFEHLKNPLAIKFGSEEHSLDTIPPSNTALIKVAREVVMKDFDVPDFVGRLGEFVTYVRRAHYHLVAAGECDIARSLHVLGRNTLKPLSEKCKTTLDMYAMTCRDILEKLQAVFEYCRDGLDDSALINLDHLGKLAAKMKDESVARANELEKAMEKAGVVLDDAEKQHATKGIEESGKWKALKKEKGEVAKLEKERKVNESKIKNATSAKTEYEKVNSSIGFWTRIGWNIAYAFKPADDKKSSNDEKYNDWIEKWQKKKTAEQAAVGAHVKAGEAREKEEEKKSSVAELEIVHKEVSKLMDCLQRALGAIRMAHMTMQKMSTFWETMQIATEKLASNEPFVECIRSATKGDKREAMRLWRARAFKMQGISYMARCVAIRDISTACSSGMSVVGKDMDLFITETPSRPDAETWLKNAPSIEEKPLDFEVFLFDKSDGVDPKNEQEARKCFQLNTSNKCSDAVQASD